MVADDCAVGCKFDTKEFALKSNSKKVAIPPKLRLGGSKVLLQRAWRSVIRLFECDLHA